MNLKEIARQVQKAQAQAAQVEARLAEERVEGSAGGGAVKIAMRCDFTVDSVSVDEGLLNPDDKEMLESLIASGIADAVRQVEAKTRSAMQEAMAGLPIPPIR